MSVKQDSPNERFTHSPSPLTISDFLNEEDRQLLVFPHNFYPMFKKAQDQYQVDVIEAASAGGEDKDDGQVCWIVRGPGSAKRYSTGCVSGAGEARQKWQARAGTKCTEPGTAFKPSPVRIESWN